MFSASFRVLTRSIRVKSTFLGHFLEFELHVFAHIAQDDTFYCYLVPSSDKTAEKIFLVKILRINDIAHNGRTKQFIQFDNSIPHSA